MMTKYTSVNMLVEEVGFKSHEATEVSIVQRKDADNPIGNREFESHKGQPIKE